MTLPVISSNIIFQEAGYFENSAISSYLRGQALLHLQVATKIPGLENEYRKGNSLCA